MRGVNSRRRQEDYRSNVAAGRSPFSPRHSAAQIRSADVEGDVFTLPVGTAPAPLQNTDGTFGFMLDYDGLDAAQLA